MCTVFDVDIEKQIAGDRIRHMRFNLIYFDVISRILFLKMRPQTHNH